MAKGNIVQNIQEKVTVASSKAGKFSPYFSFRYFTVLLIVILAALFLLRNKNWIVVALVNGQPIWRWQLEQRLVKRYAAPTMEEIINEQLIKQAAAKKGITVTPGEVASKISDVEKTLQGKISLNDALAQQGMTLNDFQGQIELQLLAEKLTAGQTSVSDSEINDFIAKNGSTLSATDAAGIREEAKKMIITKKRTDAFRKLFDELKNQSKVQKFL